MLLTQEEHHRLCNTGLRVTRFSYPLAEATVEVIADALVTVGEHHPSEIIWVQHTWQSTMRTTLYHPHKSSTRNFVYRTIPAILEKMSTLSIRDLDLRNKRVFMRVDFNVPLAPGGKEITSDKRIKASLPSIQYALDHGAALILASHLGRPKGKPNPEMSLAPCAERLAAAAEKAGGDGAGLRRA